MSQPRFSVIIPTQNRLEKLRRALSSLEHQIFTDYELLLVDDGSVDGTQDYVVRGELTREFPGIRRIRTLRNDRGVGAGMARNQALELAQGEFIAFLDDDDKWLPGYLHEQAGRLDRNPSASAIVARHLEFDVKGRTREPDLEMLLEYDNPLIYLLTESFVHTMSVLAARRTAFEEIGFLDTGFSITHDWEWCSRLLLAGKTLLPPAGPELVLHEVPGGLVTRLGEWYEEEQSILNGIFEHHTEYARYRSGVMAYRNLFFARLAFSRGETLFGMRRLASAISASPAAAARITNMKVRRNRQRSSRQGDE